ncbi:UNVERIFIED_CONTAM: hypothetical protein GTU68_060575 [Idotea baltica]|nr:hypothetical protein [Idotea baltica]
MQEGISQMKAELEKKEFEASSGGGAVSVRVTGAFEVREVSINPEVVSAGDVSMLQDLVMAATNEALRDARSNMKEEMSKLTGGMPIPGLV